MTQLSVIDALEAVVSSLPEAEIRTGQRDMSHAVDLALATNKHLVVQAGTGTGKTLAYLVPAFMSGRRIVITTATKALQDQLADKDLPFLSEHLVPLLDREITWAILKGRSNYVCRQRIVEIAGTKAGSDSDTLFDVDDLSPASTREVHKLVDWSNRTTSGDRAELDWPTSESAWRAVSVGSDECPGANRCPSGDSCFAEFARFRASEADIVVVNSHLYGAHVASGGALLPEHDVLIVDEAHGLEDTMSDSVALTIHAGRLHFLASALRRIIADSTLPTKMSQAADSLSRTLEPLLGQRLSIPFPIDVLDELGVMRRIAADVLDALRAIDTKVDSSDEGTKQRKLRAQSLATRLAEDIDQAVSVSAAFVPFVSGSERSPRLDIAPLDVGPVLKTAIWDKATAILTSATIPQNLPQRIGIPLEATDTLVVESPFDYQTQSILYCSAHLPNPNDSSFSDMMHDELVHLISAAGGRTLALFTSYRAMDAAVEAVRPLVPHTILSQREYEKNRLISLFSSNESSCLFATSGFFQGIDIPGRTLSLVTIDRIPFPRPDDPLLSARREAVGTSAFREIDIPRAATLLAQASGRLIRNASDRGVVAIFDPRLAKAGYRKDILQALPPMRRSIKRSEAEDFLKFVTL